MQPYNSNAIHNLVVPVGIQPAAPEVLNNVVPDQTSFILGDNGSFGGSEDSRYFRPVDAMAITEPGHSRRLAVT